MKKIIKHIIIVILLVVFSINSNAYPVKKLQSFNYDNKTIIFNDTSFDENQQTDIAGTLVNTATVQTASSIGFICFFFGHDFQTGYVTAITHRVYSTPPRCLKETFEIKVCKRCGYFETELVGRCFIDCCP
jgi:hypothetical protein